MSTEKTPTTAPVDAVVIPFSELQYGFQYGAAKVTRLFSDETKGWVTLSIETPKQTIQVYVTRTGKIRIHDHDGEWFRLSNDCCGHKKTTHLNWGQWGNENNKQGDER